ncbi:unnamed protein product [Anisakis simplex]|uniref:SCAPER_N domain-containing protein n=1 Tax=Anisakis simplex TaxID=6269 RepID=A0A0M3J966_ANISI|nr:unnamed protein product [Anisakis simplex]
MSDLQGSVARDKPKPAVKVEAVSATQQQRVSKQQVTSKSSKSINQSPYSKRKAGAGDECVELLKRTNQFIDQIERIYGISDEPKQCSEQSLRWINILLGSGDVFF